jgi:hypothetical protein
MKEHKFFERNLNNNLEDLASELTDRYKMIKNVEIEGVTPVGDNEVWKSSGSISTMKWREYNVFQFHIEGIYNLYQSISDMMKEACEYYDIDFVKSKYMMQGWFNINNAKDGKLDWHDHSAPGDFAPLFHGYYCVNAEPSSTYYMLFNDPSKVVENPNRNNRAIISEMGHPHAQGDWSWDGPRITVAYDIVPFDRIKTYPKDQEQHWIPLI